MAQIRGLTIGGLVWGGLCIGITAVLCTAALLGLGCLFHDAKRQWRVIRAWDGVT